MPYAGRRGHDSDYRSGPLAVTLADLCPGDQVRVVASAVVPHGVHPPAALPPVGHRGNYGSLAFSPEGRRLVAELEDHGFWST